MIVILKHNPNKDQLESLISWLQEKGIIIHTSIGEAHTILGLVGDTSKLDIDLIKALDIVEEEVPPGGHRGEGGQYPDRRRQPDPHGGPLLRGE